ncbi:MAG TPA: carboxypeptidase regulatory-like domain-containing protein [Terracidiphilus sp.]|nr:carboxypeptidase regulatory-like domain-containing protein [Terracidiphilus sp.]
MRIPKSISSSVSLCILLTLTVMASTLKAQLETGQIAGTVMDQTGAAVPNAVIAVNNLSTNTVRNTVSSSSGAYLVPGLEPDIYQVTVSSNNFRTFVGRVEVTVGGHVTLDARLSVSNTTTEVQVVGEGGAQVNTQTQEMSQVVDNQQLTQLPSLTRNPYDFVALAGNVSGGDNSTNSGTTAIDQTGSGQNQQNRGVGYSINGQRESGTEILLDGVENVSIYSQAIGEDVPLDGTQEYSIITSNYSAEYGRASGGVINVTTKAGTNNFHGSAWEYNRLSAYTANTYGNDAANSAFIQSGQTAALPDPKGEYTRNQFGYSAGGPIKKDKLFIFESTEWTRVRSAASESEEIFDPAFIVMMPADIQAYYQTYGQTTLPSAGVASTVGQIEAKGVNFGEVNGTTPIPASTPMFDTINFKAPFDAGGGIPQNTYELVGRVDYNPTNKTQMFFRGARESSIQALGSDFYSAYPQYNTGTTYLNQSYLYSVSHIFTPSLFLSVKASFTRFNENNTFDPALTYVPNLMFVSPTDPSTESLIQMPGLENESEPGLGGLPAGGPQNTIQIEPDISWTKGKHSMRFGFAETYIQLNYGYGAYAQAVEQLGAGFQDSLNDMMNTVGNPNGAPLINFQARFDPQGKLPCSADTSTTDGNFGYTIDTASCAVTAPLLPPSYGRSYRYKDWSGYGEDSYKVTQQLTINAGLRFEHYGVQHNNHPDLDSNFYFGSGGSLEAQVRSGQVQIADQSAAGGFWKSRWGTFAPRVGFAFDIFGNGRDSIRGGYGLSYERNFGNITFNASFNPPASAIPSTTCAAEDVNCAVTVSNNDLSSVPIVNGVGYVPPVEMRHIDQNIEVAQTQFWSLALQHQFAPGTLIEVAYVGAKGSHLYDLANVNEQGAGQVYLGDPVVQSNVNCANSGMTNLNTGIAECLTRPNPQYTNINMRGSAAGSSYNGLNLRVQMQNLHRTGLSLTGNYTWSHALDELSSTFGDSLQGGSGYIGSLGYTSLADPGLDWGSADYDVRQRLTLAPIWQAPWFKQGSRIEREALGGWALSGIYTARGGVPFSVFDYSEDETFYTVPRLEPATPFYSASVSKKPQIVGTNNFNGLNIPLPKDFVPLSSTLGISDFGPFPSDMMHRNSIRGPGAWNFDASLHKTFPLTEHMGLEFSADGIDVLNHHNFYVNTATLDYDGATTTPLNVQELRGGLGTLATGGNHDERRFGQFALKLEF